MRNDLGVAAVTLILGAGSAGCVALDETGDPTGAALETGLCPTIDQRSLIETSPKIVTDERFGLQRVFEQIRATTPEADELALPDAREMFRQLFADYGQCDGVDPRGYGLRCREDEAAVGELDPFTTDREGLHFAPVAIVNRFDLAGASSSSCGESRIVYWKDRGPVLGKLGFIVELSTPPVIDGDTRSCGPILDFWASLSLVDDPGARADMLEAFLVDGLPGMAYAPLSARGAGWDGAGQLRSNTTAGFKQWNMREVKWTRVCELDACEARFVLVDTKNSPSQRLFSGSHMRAGEFERWFLDSAVPTLARATDVGQLALGNPPAFNAYESISQPLAGDPTSVLYGKFAGAPLRGRIDAKLAALGSDLTAKDVLARASAMTCGGCHRQSRGADLGGGMVFPSPVGFAHVGEAGALSPAMQEVFLPARRNQLQRAACAAPSPTPVSAPADLVTINGKPMHAPD